MTDRKLQLEDWLDDLCVRFIINIPAADLSHVPRICFQVEEAQWYYEDFIRPLDPSLPSMTLRNFCLKIFLHCPLLSNFSESIHMRAFEEFLLYKTRVPVRGVILLSADMDEVVLVKGWKKGANWSFPRGKINKDEDDLTCAIREAYEETGYDLEQSGLVPKDRSLVKGIDVTGHGQQIRLYVFRNVPRETYFEAQTRKEISKIDWWRLSDLPAYRKKGQQQNQPEAAANANKFYMVAPFLPPLKKWILDQKKKDARTAANNQHLEAAGNISHDEGITEDDQLVEPSINYDAPVSHDAERTRRNAADLALSAIMQVQPSTQGLQHNAINPAQSQASHSSGQQLLALLHSKPPADQPPPTQPYPQTPLENTITQIPFPKTPHHQVPHPSHISNQPPPPPFPLQQQQEQRPMQNYSYQQPDLQVRSDQRPIPNMQYRHQMPQQIPQQIPQRMPAQMPQQFSAQISQQLPQHMLQQASQHMTQHIPQHMQTQLPQQRERHPYQPTLIHPQPLPLNAQKVLFTGGPVHSTMVPQHIQQQPPHPNFTTSGPLPPPQFPNVHSTMVPPLPKEAPAAALTSHSLLLLNAFKNRDEVNVNITSNSLISEGPTQPHPNSTRPEALELPGESSRSIPVPLPTEAAQSSKSHPSMKGDIPSTAGQSQTARPPISENQRSMLLGMFKSPAAQPATLAAEPAAVVLPSNSPSAVELSAVELISPPEVSRQTASKENTPIGRASHKITGMNPELNLPFRATSILARPANGNKDAKSYGSLSKKPATRSEMPNSSKRPSSEKSFQPQILKRPQANTVKASPLLGASTIAAYSPNPAPSNLAGPSSSPLSFTSQAPQSTEQKHTLLSLFGKSPTPAPSSIFGKSPMPASSSMSRTSSHDGPSSNHLIDATRSAASRSRVGSLASGNGEGSSRRGSQAPISPADKGFLLNYLDAVASRGY
ncbi:uncharacterized protein EAE97_010085 [Botrytis byssoidea]|uniref:Nudix hydrolase domain-containing protein n=1 Tax=Botrytis byssoidea TaxID=139641 RepID=A0A9P5LL03_9HELO|nr:uncharacterized protein EAE97_010085 [Botrytis byssoidea]KAF7927410.1 hypothetical protein EAE97_010085 [Botrytis byssoidea]